MKRLAGLITVMHFIAATAANAADDLQVERGRVLYSYGTTQPKSLTLRQDKRGPGVVAQEAVLESGSRFLRLHFTVVKGRDKTDWRVELKPRRGPNIAMEIPRGAAEYWSPEIPGDSAVVMLVTTSATTDAQVLVDKVVVSTTEVRPESITTKRTDIVPIRQQSGEIQHWGQSVARIRFVGADGKAYVCTGFLIGERLLMTNQHCLDTAQTAASALIDFNFDEPQATPEVSRVAKFHFANYALDYALVDLDKQPAGTNSLTLSAKPLAAEPDKPWSPRAAIVIQHPAGEFKQVSIFSCAINEPQVAGRSSKSDFGHLCNTLGGSSGSPVMDPVTGAVVGLHHFGFKTGMAKPFNQGVLLGPILEDVKAQDQANLVVPRINTDRTTSSGAASGIRALVSDSVTEVISIKPDGIYYGTAFSVGDHLFLTAASLAGDADEIHLRLQDGSTPGAKLVKALPLRGFSLLRAPDAEVAPLRLAERDPKEGTEIFVVGFLRGDPMPMVDAGVVTTTGVPYFTYARNTSTAPGLAGAPVTLASGEVVGLHIGATASGSGNGGRAVRVNELRGALPEFAAESGPEENEMLMKRRWKSYVDLGCSGVMNGEVNAEIPLKGGERIVNVSAALEDMDNLTEVMAPVVVEQTKNSARIQFQVQPEKGFLNFGCKGGSRASVAVTFLVASETKPVFKK